MVALPQRVSRSATRKLARWLLVRWCSGIRHGCLVVEFPDGQTACYGSGESGQAGHIRVMDEDFFPRLLFHGEIGFGEAYMDGLWRSDNLVELLELGILNRRYAGPTLRWLSKAASWKDRLHHRRRRNTPSGSQHNVRDHYDLSNDFFKLFLDETMTYSCAVFTDERQPVAEAQRNKYQRICELAGISPGDSVLEIGTGWGGFAIYVAQRYGCEVTTITISPAQHDLARRRVEEAGLAEQVQVRLCDYREVDGRFDRIVSIEMFEAVGAEYFPTFFRKCDEALKPGGRLAMQVITIPDRAFEAHRRGVNWLQKHIFPGGVLPSLSAIEKALGSTSLLISRVEDIGANYTVTLRRWQERFLANLQKVRDMGFDERFIRTWEYYLASCEAAFRVRHISDVQIAFDRAPA